MDKHCSTTPAGVLQTPLTSIVLPNAAMTALAAFDAGLAQMQRLQQVEACLDPSGYNTAVLGWEVKAADARAKADQLLMAFYRSDKAGLWDLSNAAWVMLLLLGSDGQDLYLIAQRSAGLRRTAAACARSPLIEAVTLKTDTIFKMQERIESNEQFAADVAHEIKNPLAFLRSAVGSLRIVKREDHRENLLEVIEHDVRRLDRLVSDISNASRMDSELVKEEEETVRPAQDAEQSERIFGTGSRGEGRGVYLRPARSTLDGPRARRSSGAGLRQPDHQRNCVLQRGQRDPRLDPAAREPNPDRSGGYRSRHPRLRVDQDLRALLVRAAGKSVRQQLRSGSGDQQADRGSAWRRHLGGKHPPHRCGRHVGPVGSTLRRGPAGLIHDRHGPRLCSGCRHGGRGVLIRGRSGARMFALTYFDEAGDLHARQPSQHTHEKAVGIRHVVRPLSSITVAFLLGCEPFVLRPDERVARVTMR